MKRKIIILFVVFILIAVVLVLTLLENERTEEEQTEVLTGNSLGEFITDKVYNSPNDGEIHYGVYYPKDYDLNKEYDLYITLPGYEGLYFQGVGANLEAEDFALNAVRMRKDLIVVAPQLEDWGDTSANQTIALIEYFKSNYNIDKVFANGYSAGGETMSLVMEKRADLIDRYLQVSSKWDGDFEMTVENEVPVYFVIGQNDEYYGSEPTKDAYYTLYSMYQRKGLSEEEIDEILILDIKKREYFLERGFDNEHGGGSLIAYDEDIMKWLLND
ncbi:alpha/beta hydrolase [Anaerofustis stercorihominis]|uniref:alpha/beta hydrolase n=1 Tax=Anaerofustis stercorihominis TaxID=214853 RepID=UPI001106E76F|nr:alpha/beta hydrolase [Anaerofustis stercorihominis]